jgi:hypothetical protein
MRGCGDAEKMGAHAIVHMRGGERGIKLERCRCRPHTLLFHRRQGALALPYGQRLRTLCCPIEVPRRRRSRTESS